jgi:hypothetical protein
MPSHLFKKSSRLFFAIVFLLCMPAGAKAAGPQAPITLLSTTYLPEITGDFDHFAVDLKRNHLFVSAEVHHSVEMFDLKTGAHLQSIGGFKTPHSIAFAPEKDELLVADGGDSALILLPEMTFTELIVSNSSMAQQPEKAIHQMQRITMLQIAYTTLGMVASQLTSLTPKSLSSLSIKASSSIRSRFPETMWRAWG